MNHYEILGIKPSASQDEIKSAYRKKVMEFHPDHYGNDTTEFRRIQEAYSVLTDPEQRRLYDETLKGRKKYKRLSADPISPYPSETVLDNYDISSLFIELRHKLFHAFSSGHKGYDVEVLLSRQESLNGGRITINIPVEEVCPDCKGYCYRGFSICRRCQGNGVILYKYPFAMSIPPGVHNNDIREVLINKYDVLLRIVFLVDRR